MKISESRLGIGVNYRTDIADGILQYQNEIDCLEVYTEKFFIKDDDYKLERILQNTPLILHGLDLSLGSSTKDCSTAYITQLEDVLNERKHEWFSDHLSLTIENEIEVGHLMPIQFEDENITRIVSKIQKVSKLSSMPFLVENITYYYLVPGSMMPEVEFLSKILNQADCGMLLDLNNLYINSVNFQYDPYEFLNKLPLERVIEIHLAGGSYKEGMLIDTHANPIKQAVWDLFAYACKKTPFKAAIIERDSNLPIFEDLLEEVRLARHIINS